MQANPPTPEKKPKLFTQLTLAFPNQSAPRGACAVLAFEDPDGQATDPKKTRKTWVLVKES